VVRRGEYVTHLFLVKDRTAASEPRPAPGPRTSWSRAVPSERCPSCTTSGTGRPWTSRKLVAVGAYPGSACGAPCPPWPSASTART
ncbi:unnamed protein product, partial [Prorocentrum cordatum]